MAGHTFTTDFASLKNNLTNLLKISDFVGSLYQDGVLLDMKKLTDFVDISIEEDL